MSKRTVKTFEEVSKNFLTVGKLIEHLQKYPKDMLVGKVGHYGEFHYMNESDFTLSNAYYESREYEINQRDLGKVLDIMAPNIGEDPD
jgi:hypothetical protein